MSWHADPLASPTGSLVHTMTPCFRDRVRCITLHPPRRHFAVRFVGVLSLTPLRKRSAFASSASTPRTKAWSKAAASLNSLPTQVCQDGHSRPRRPVLQPCILTTDGPARARSAGLVCILWPFEIVSPVSMKLNPIDVVTNTK